MPLFRSSAFFTDLIVPFDRLRNAFIDGSDLFLRVFRPRNWADDVVGAVDCTSCHFTIVSSVDYIFVEIVDRGILVSLTDRSDA